MPEQKALMSQLEAAVPEQIAPLLNLLTPNWSKKHCRQSFEHQIRAKSSEFAVLSSKSQIGVINLPGTKSHPGKISRTESITE